MSTVAGVIMCTPNGHKKHDGEAGTVILETRCWVVLEFKNGDRYMYPKKSLEK